jgi:lipid-A-disaccharide synthase
MKYYIIAGEASGDLHGSNLIKELRKNDAGADIRCWGGDKMQAAGGQVVKHIKDLAFMGFAEVVKHLGTILNNVKFCKQDILAYQPDVVILIDYPGFNFRLFKFLKQHNIRVFYYISPQIWAWRTSRVFKVKKYVERMFVIFPFEKDFYAKYGVQVDFVGHPLLDELNPSSYPYKENEKVIALLPGSRKQEIAALLPEYLKIIDRFPDYRFVVTGISNIGEPFYRNIIGNSKCELVMDRTYETLRKATAAVVTSGTATLETALHYVPEVVCYKGSWLSYLIAHLVIDKSIGYICIVNLISKRKVVEELIQANVNKERLTAELQNLLNENTRERMLNNYTALHRQLGSAGASKRTAELITGYLKDGN